MEQGSHLYNSLNKKGAQYEGYKRLPPAVSTNGRKKIETDEEAAEFVAKQSGFDWAKGPIGPKTVLQNSADFMSLYKTAMRRLHPDNNETGNETLFVELQEAAAILKKRHSLT